jgi:hypothetical protein
VNDDVVASGDPLGPVDYKPGIIFGAGNKLRHYGPFLSLFEAFRERLRRSQVVVTIGCPNMTPTAISPTDGLT